MLLDEGQYIINAAEKWWEPKNKRNTRQKSLPCNQRRYDLNIESESRNAAWQQCGSWALKCHSTHDNCKRLSTSRLRLKRSQNSLLSTQGIQTLRRQESYGSQKVREGPIQRRLGPPPSNPSALSLTRPFPSISPPTPCHLSSLSLHSAHVTLFPSNITLPSLFNFCIIPRFCFTCNFLHICPSLLSPSLPLCYPFRLKHYVFPLFFSFFFIHPFQQ